MFLAGMTVASSSHDKSIRIWEKSEEVLVLEEEKEQQREKEFDAEIEQEENPVVCYRGIFRTNFEPYMYNERSLVTKKLLS